MIEHIIPPNIGEIKLSIYLRRAYPMQNLGSALKKRDVKINGLRGGADSVVRGGDELKIYAEMDTSLKIIYRGEGFLCAVKPQGLAVDADSMGIGADTLLTRARLIDENAELCHRLDAPTGGVILLATEKVAYEKALAAFKEKRVEKRYIALIGGKNQRREGVFNDYLIKNSREAKVKIVTNPKNALPVETRWRIIDNVNADISRAALFPVTGRTHQLRAHMAFHGMPILGDDKYGDYALNKKYSQRLCLWCEYIKILGHEFYEPAPDWLG